MTDICGVIISELCFLLFRILRRSVKEFMICSTVIRCKVLCNVLCDVAASDNEHDFAALVVDLVSQLGLQLSVTKLIEVCTRVSLSLLILIIYHFDTVGWATGSSCTKLGVGLLPATI